MFGSTLRLLMRSAGRLALSQEYFCACQLGASIRGKKYNETRIGPEIKGLHRNLDAETFTSLNLDTEDASTTFVQHDLADLDYSVNHKLLKMMLSIPLQINIFQ